MSQRQGGDENGFLTWFFIGSVCFGVIGTMAWIVGSHAIVWHTAPIVRALGSIWNVIPIDIARINYNDIQVEYFLMRKNAATISFGDWFSYVNKGFQPYSYLFIGLAALLFMRQMKAMKAKRLNDKMSPTDLAAYMMSVFSEIAPVVMIQEKLVGNKLKKWARQVFPEEFIKKTRYQGKTVLLPDPDAERTDGDRGLMLDEPRLVGALTQCKPYKYEGVTLLDSRFLGRQIVDVVKDGQAAKAGKKIVFADRFSDVGKAIFAILAPYAFGAKKGREQSRRVIDALNYSAYGSPEGEANLSIREVAESFNEWRNHAMAHKLAKIHHWEYTYLFSLLEQARRSGKIGTWSFIWLKPMNRVMFYVLNTCGRKTPHSEAALAFSQVQFEQRAVKEGAIPITKDGRPSIYTTQVVAALVEEWDAWRKGDDDNENWWKDDALLDSEALLDALSAMSVAPTVPAGAE